MKKQEKYKGIIFSYMDYMKFHNEEPEPIFILDNDKNLEFCYFYQYIKHDEDIQNSIFTKLFNNTVDSLKESYKYKEFGNCDKVLSFYYIFFELLTANREYILKIIEHKKNGCFNNKHLSSLKIKLLKHASNLGLKTMKITHTSSEKKEIKQTAWEEFILVFNFWLQDSSREFGKTAIFIHETINKNRNNKKAKSFLELNDLLYQNVSRT